MQPIGQAHRAVGKAVDFFQFEPPAIEPAQDGASAFGAKVKREDVEMT